MSHSNPYDRNEAFWNRYLKGRPKVPDGFFDMVFSYHAEHGGRFGVVHETGAGGGVHSARLAKRFERVLVSDPSEENLRIAKARLGADGGKYSFRLAKLEEIGDAWPGSGSVDLVFCAVIFHFTDTQRALQAIAEQLQPGGGTLVIAGWGYLRLDDPVVQRLWDKIVRTRNVAFYQRALVHAPSEEAREKSRAATRVGGSAYDAVAISGENLSLV
jgi:trans-aconitate 3-methyltransferase